MTDIPTPESRASETHRKHKKSERWLNDPEILARLNIVAHLMLEGKPAHEICAAFEPPVSLRTTKRDIARVKQIWRIKAEEGLDNSRIQAVEQYGKVIQEAWKRVNAQPEKADRFLTIVLSAQGNLDKLTGALAPEKTESQVIVSGTLNIDDIRRKRWEQVANVLQETGG